MDGGNHRCSIISDHQRGQCAHQERCDSNTGTIRVILYALLSYTTASTSASTKNSTQFTKNQYKQHKVYIFNRGSASKDSNHKSE